MDGSSCVACLVEIEAVGVEFAEWLAECAVGVELADAEAKPKSSGGIAHG